MLTPSSLLTSTFVAISLALSVFACTASVAEPADDDALAASNESEIHAAAFLGTWTGTNVQAGEFASLVLKSGGRYEASIAICGGAPAGGVSCMAMPRDESGTFTLLTSGGKQTLRLRPTGAPVRRYQMALLYNKPMVPHGWACIA